MGFEPTTLRDLVGCSNHRATGDSMCFAASNIVSTKERNPPIKNKAIFLHNNLQFHADCDSHKPSTGLFCSNKSNALRRLKEHSLRFIPIYVQCCCLPSKAARKKGLYDCMKAI